MSLFNLAHPPQARHYENTDEPPSAAACSRTQMGTSERHGAWRELRGQPHRGGDPSLTRGRDISWKTSGHRGSSRGTRTHQGNMTGGVPGSPTWLERGARAGRRGWEHGHEESWVSPEGGGGVRSRQERNMEARSCLGEQAVHRGTVERREERRRWRGQRGLREWSR